MKYIASLLLSSCLLASFAVNAEQECTDIKMNNVNYYAVFSISTEKSITALYQAQLAKLETFSKKNKLENFKILSQDVSVSYHSYIPTMQEVNISISFESTLDVTLIDKVHNQFKPQSLSFSQHQTSVCK